MKKNFYYCIVVACLSFGVTSCGDDGNSEMPVAFNSEVVMPADDFVDSRDGKTYPCIRIGNQVWMAKNLNYNIPGNSLRGCYTWGESMANTPDKADIKLDDAIALNICADVANDPKYEFWPQYAYTLPNGIVLMPGNQYIMNNLSYGMDYIVYFPEFKAVVDPLLDAKKDELYVEIVNQSAFEHFKEAEEDNKGYVEDYGYLYSYDAAQTACPEGWRLPSDEDWLELEKTLGLNAEEAEQTETWRGTGLSTLLNVGGKSGFNAQKAGGNVYMKNKGEVYMGKDENDYYWSSTSYNENDSTTVGMFRMTALYTDKVWRGTTRLSNVYRDVLYSVRCVKDAE